MTVRNSVALRFAGLFIAGSLAAVGTCIGASPSEPSDTIQVEASAAEVRKKVETFVTQVTRADGEIIGRWRDPMCPLVIGLSDAQNKFVRTRMLEVEAKVRERRADQDHDCRPNVFVIITDDADNVLESWKQNDASMFLWKTREDLLHSAQAGPVRIWHNAVELRSDDGPWVYDDIGPKRKIKKGRLKDSRIEASAKEAISMVVVLIDAKRIGKVTLAQTSDYLAMICLSQIELRADVGTTNTILKLFGNGQSGPLPPGLTDWDFAFLNALYRVGYYSPMHQRMDLTSRMSRELGAR
jgi:hypothetical protein